MRYDAIRRGMPAVVLAALLLVTLAPLTRSLPTIFRHHEAAGAREQLALLDAFIPEDAVILAGGAKAIDLFGPALSVGGRREVLTYYTSAVTPAIPADIVEKVGEAALAGERPFFFAAPGDDPPPGRLRWARAWWAQWSWSQLVSRDGPESLTREEWPVQIRLYRALYFAPAGEASALNVPLYEAEALLSQTGRIVEDDEAGNGWAREATAGRDAAGPLVYGPYVELPPGSYLAKYTLRTNDDLMERPPTVAVIGAGVREIASRTIDRPAPTYRAIGVPFELEQRERVEFTLFFHDVGAVWLDHVEVEALDRGG